MALLAAVCGCAVTGSGERPKAAETTDATEPSAKGAKEPIDARELYLESLKQQALQPSINLVHEYYRQEKFYPEGSRDVVVSGFDYRTKNVRLERSQVIVADGKTSTAWGTWCLGRSEDWFYSSGVRRPWEKRSTTCPSLTDQTWLNDGLGVGGLTAQQADAFVGYLGDLKGFINAGGMSSVTRNGKPYVRLEIKVKPVKLAGGGRPVGADLYQDAFKYTELDSLTHPYGYLASGGSALDIVRYIDPETRLPVYSETLETGGGVWKMHRVEYEFGRPVTKSTLPAAEPPIARLTWQPESKSGSQ
ncbi:hypothetical protein GCM10009780_29030 [Actinomadura alba]